MNAIKKIKESNSTNDTVQARGLLDEAFIEQKTASVLFMSVPSELYVNPLMVRMNDGIQSGRKECQKKVWKAQPQTKDKECVNVTLLKSLKSRGQIPSHPDSAFDN